MAIENAKMLNVRIKNKYDSYENWAASGLVLEAGEIAICHTTVDVAVDNGVAKHPALLMKVGDGEKTFANLPWMSAKAADVLSVCKNEADLTEFVNSVIADAGIASDDAMQALAGRVTTAEGKVTTLEGKMTTAEGKITDAEAAIATLNGLVGSTAVATQISDAINELNLAGTYEAKGEAAKVQTALDTYKTSNDAAVQKNATDIAGEIARAKAAEEANAGAITAIKDGTTIDSFADVEAALAGKQATGDYATKAEAQGYANAKDEAIAAAKKAGDDAAAAAKTAQDGVDALNGLVGSETVAKQIGDAITDLDLDNTYDEKGAAAAAEAAAKEHATGLNTAMNTRVEALEAIDHDHSNKTVLDGITAEKVTAWDAAEQNAKDYADGLNTTMDGRVAALEEKFTGEDSVADQIADAIADEATLRDNADKALQALIEANDADILALQGLVGGDTVAKQIEDAVAAEAEIARAAEKANADAIANVVADYLKAADKTELQGNIDTLTGVVETLRDGIDAEKVDGVKDLIDYVDKHGAEVTGMKDDIKQNADDIDALEGRIDAAEDAIDTKAAQDDLEALTGRVTTVEGKVATLEGEMDAVEGRATALEGLVGGKSVATQIEEALKVDGVEKYALATDLADAEQTHADDKAALEEAIALKANDADLAAIAKTGSTDDLVQGVMTLVFDCGGAGV